MLYTKVLHGWMELTYDFNGNCQSLEWVQNDSMPVERRALREESDGKQTESQLEDNEIIEHEDDLAFLESKEKFCDIIVQQPLPVVK